MELRGIRKWAVVSPGPSSVSFCAPAGRQALFQLAGGGVGGMGMGMGGGALA